MFKHMYQTASKFLKFTSIKKLGDKFEEFFTKLIWRDSDQWVGGNLKYSNSILIWMEEMANKVK